MWQDKLCCRGMITICVSARGLLAILNITDGEREDVLIEKSDQKERKWGISFHAGHNRTNGIASSKTSRMRKGIADAWVAEFKPGEE